VSDSDERQVFGGRYELQRHIARGGMADVYLARDVMLDRPVALKVLFPELSRDRSFVDRFRREAQAAANLSHPNIVSVFDYGEEEGYSFIVMEFIDGRPLSQVIRADGPLDPERAAEIGAAAADALFCAHRSGVVHRDVKPGNVLIDSMGHVKVADFGIARATDTDQDLTQTGSVMGTATYISPEQATGDRVDPRSDVYSLGVVLYEMVVGRPPFQADSTMAIALKHVNELPPPPSALKPDVPPEIEAIIVHSLAKDPDERYATAEQQKDDLLRFIHGKPVAAPLVAGAMTAADEPTMAQATVAMSRQQGTQVLTRQREAAVATADVEERESKTTPYVVTLLVLLGILGVLLFLLARSVGFGGGASVVDTVTLPDVTNKAFEEAKGQLEGLGLRVAEPTMVENEAPAGVVLAQNPEAGESADEGSEVVLTVSAGPGAVTVPDVRGMTVQEATEALTAAGFEDVVQKSVASSEVEPEHVVNTNPPIGTAHPTSTRIELQVSSGAETVRVPNVIGRSAEDAVDRLEAEGFRPIVEREASSSVKEGNVISTDPAAGEDAPSGSEVTVVVSSGPNEIEVPDVVGLSEAKARAELDAAGFRVQVQYVSSTDPTEHGLVVDQDPDGGETAQAESTVIIRVARVTSSSTSTTEPDTTTTTQQSTTSTLPGNRP
jgi:beta-lactam-binding protein with PASTA domain/tRNA A-37 threonylcarbamoyl transferase component Bud32